MNQNIHSLRLKDLMDFKLDMISIKRLIRNRKNNLKNKLLRKAIGEQFNSKKKTSPSFSVGRSDKCNIYKYF